MEIKFNNSIKEIQESSSLQLLLNDIMPQKQTGIAIAVNNAVIPRSEWKACLLKPMDDVLIINATQGG